VRAFAPRGIIFSGGPASVHEGAAPKVSPEILNLGLPVLGICYGLHWMTHQLGGKVVPGKTREYGHAQVVLSGDSRLFRGLPAEMKVWMSHGDEAREIPAGFRAVARTSNALAAMEDPERRYWAVQFHPEVQHTPLGTEVLKNFVFGICDAKPNWTPQRFVDESVQQIKQTVGDQGHAICALSGGVDSSVAATLVSRAIGNRLTCVFVNNGVLRKNEFQKVQQTLRDKLGLNLIAVDASRRFLDKLAGVTDPEKKRKIIGAEFIAVFDDEAARIIARDANAGAAEFLVQGTLYPDVIE
jgi:GMP synthase (glutamine-hydrolysing)